MELDPLGSYLRTHRRRSGLTLQELAHLLGYKNEMQVLRHEQSHTLPPLLVALGYEAIFRTSIAELFPGAHRTIEQIVGPRLAKMETDLQELSAKGRGAAATARKLEWLTERKDFV
jgi:hypothetical protein